MNAIAVPKSRAQNRLEGIALTAIFQGLPTFAAAAMLLKLAGHEIAGRAMLFVVLASTFYALLSPWLSPKFPKFFKNGLRAAVLRRESAGRRKARAMAGAAGSIASAHDDDADAVVAGGGAG